MDQYPHPPMDTGVDPINRPGAVLITLYSGRGPFQVVGRTVRDFIDWLLEGGITVNGREVLRVLAGMERVGLLIDYGIDTDQTEFGRVYMSYPEDTSQDDGLLWLAEVLGGELIIPAYIGVTVQITGYPAAKKARPLWGTGLILDRTHVLTNRHVVKKMARNIQIHAPEQHFLTPAEIPAAVFEVDREEDVHFLEEDPEDIDAKRDDLDVAVIELPLCEEEGGMTPLEGMMFRDPEWADETYVFGYPRVPSTAEMDITVQHGKVANPSPDLMVYRGEVVNPSAEAMLPSRPKIFLYSAITRPGNSGGPIVADDGRVIGLVVEDSTEPESSDPEAISGGNLLSSGQFYRGIPTSEVVRALRKINPDYGELVRVEDWR